jgi:hypothetical protein
MAPTLGLAIALIVIGLLGLLFLPFGLGLVVAAVGVILLIAYLIGFGKRAAEPPA